MVKMSQVHFVDQDSTLALGTAEKYILFTQYVLVF